MRGIIPTSGDSYDDDDSADNNVNTITIREIRRRIEANMREMVTNGHI